MIIDVTDLKFTSLNFSRKYDIARHSKGRMLYNNGAAQIKSVDKIDDETYEITATVEGNYDDYEVNLSICRTLINKSKCTCQDYRNGYLCKHIIATSMEVIEPHYASTIEGQRKMKQKEAEEERRRQELYRQRQEEERKRLAYQRKYFNSLQTINAYKEMNYTPLNSNNLDLQGIYEKTMFMKSQKTGELATSIKLEPKFELQGTKTLKLTLKIGQTRMYVLNSISDLYQAYQNESELYYGKQLRFIPKKENFENESQALFDYVIEYAKIIDYNNKFNRYGGANLSEKELFITGDKIEELFGITKKIVLNSYLNGDQEFEFTDEKLDIKCILQKEKVKGYGFYYWEEPEKETEEYVLSLNISDYSVLLSNSYIYVFYKNKIYKMQKETELIRIFEMFKDEDNILIPEDKLNDFREYVLPRIKHIESNNLPAELVQEGLIANRLASKILLDIDDKGNILLELKFCYNNYEFNILENGYKTYIKQNNIVRDIPAETEVIKRIFMDGFELISGRKNFVLRNTDEIYEFLFHKIEGYMKDFEVLVTDSFKNKQIKQPKISNIGVRIDNGLLEINISKMNIDISEIKDILKDYNIKKKYHKLKNGDFLNLSDSEDLKLLDEMQTTLDIDYNKIENGIINLPINRSVYLEKLLGSNADINSTKNDEFVSLINNIGNTEISENIAIDEEFEKILRDYQKVGYKWLKTLEYYKFGGILADDMGLGKTLQVIAVLRADLKTKNTSIVVCPSTLVLNWKAEIEKWCPKMKVLVIKGTAEERRKLINDYEKYDLVITSYDLLKRDIDAYEGKNFKYIIADEAQYIKNSLTQNATALKALNGEVRFALTGTPIENSIAELWSIFDFIMPGYLYSYSKFKKKFEEPILKLEDKEALTRLKKLISPFILRRVKKDVLTELPEKNITIMKNEMETEQEKIYLSYLAQTKKEVAEELNDSSFEKSKFKILMLLTRLRQICCHPSLFIENYSGSSGKLKQCLDLITDAIEAGHKILLFSSYTSMFEIIEKELNRLNIQYFKLIGDTPVDKRIEMVDEFNSKDEVKIFLISLKAGGTGLNLTSADVVIHYDPWWNVSSENQATDRAYRIGQKNSVQVYKLITSNSIEEKINKMQERKEELSKDLLSTEETFINKLTKEEILNLFE